MRLLRFSFTLSMMAISMLTATVVSCKLIKSDMVVIQPQQFDGENLRPYEGDSLFYRNLELVLQHYHEEVVRDAKGGLLIWRWLNDDKELIWNYTTKANNREWLEMQGLGTGR